MGKTVKNLAALEKELEALREQGRKKIVFTNGCFDLIHAGHVRYLREAKKLGDVLIVGLNSDSSVSRIKPGRPVNAEKERAEVLAALGMVDYVVIFGEDTPYALIKAIRPDVLVKGGDWKKEDIVGSDIAAETYSLPYSKGFSTTEIIGRIQSLKK
ncbi:MAG: D-glycero-beta-D-manno-heptose 1-phosphate adenylyltransferase [Nitrospiraceae bacterium]|nr:D-glycero-beta-D-manno-heptose 1-phosphate adenylyltransferase [Nitrospiraceae bacterium]